MYIEQAVKDTVSEPMMCGVAVCNGTATFYRLHGRIPSSKEELNAFCEKSENPELNISWDLCRDFSFEKLDDGKIRLRFIYLITDYKGKELDFPFTATFPPSQTSWPNIE